MAKKINKAMILAAGLGTRLRPITYETPKPLIDVGGRKLVEYNIEMLKKSGIKDVLINLHHLGGKIKNHLGDGSRYGVRISYSEEEIILGTGGGIKRAACFFGEEPFVVVNSDIITGVNIRDLIEFHQSNDVVATLVLRPLEHGNDYTPAKVDSGRLVEFGSGDMMYCGIQMIEPVVLRVLEDGVFSDIVRDAYFHLLWRGEKIGAYVYKGFWAEVGNMDKLEEVRDLFDEESIRLWYL